MRSVCLIILPIVFIACNHKTENVSATSFYDEPALKNFVVSTHEISERDALNALDSILNKAAADSSVFQQTVDFLEKPFSDPNSMYRNDGLYAELLQTKMKSPRCDSLLKAVTRKKLYLLMQNQPGSEANDFVFITPAGRRQKMHDIKANYTLLMFYNPECNACKDVKAALMASTLIINEISSGKLRLLAIYSDEDETLWRKHLHELPKDWIEGRDENEYLFNNSVYDLKAIPTLYLLDKNKNVLLKDCLDVSKIEKIIKENNNDTALK